MPDKTQDNETGYEEGLGRRPRASKYIVPLIGPNGWPTTKIEVNGDLDNALRRLKQSMGPEFRALRKRVAYTPPSERRRAKAQVAIRRHKRESARLARKR